MEERESKVRKTLKGSCGACKFLRRKCARGCVFAPYFSSEEGALRFGSVHRVFGASNVAKQLMAIPAACRGEAVATVCYEAQARISDPVHGCVSTIVALQQQVASLRAELSMVRMQLLSSKLIAENASRTSHLSQALHPPLCSLNSFASGDFAAVYLGGGATNNHHSPHILCSQLPPHNDSDEGDSQIFSSDLP